MLTSSAKELKALKKSNFWFLFLFIGPITLFVSILFQSFLVSLGLIIFAWFATKFIAGLSADTATEREASRRKTMLNLLLGDPEVPKYFCLDHALVPCAIAVDPAGDTVTTLHWSKPLNQFDNPTADSFISHTFTKNELLEWESVKPDADIYEVVGSLSNVKTSDMLSMQINNARARREQRSNTGLTLKIDRLEQQEVFVNLNYEAAKQWLLLLKKFSSGELPALTIPSEFPKPTQH